MTLDCSEKIPVQTPDPSDENGGAAGGSVAEARAPVRPFSAPGTRVIIGSTVLVAVLMLLSASSDRFAPEPARLARYGQNAEGELTRNLLMMAVETMVLLALLRPWSFWHSWTRALLALGLVTPYALLFFAVTMHSGPISTLHAFWLIGFVLVLPVVVLHALSGRFRGHQ